MKGKWPGQHKYNGTNHNFVKRAVDSMDDCFDFMDEPLYGLRVNISQEVNCTGLGLKYVVLLSFTMRTNLPKTLDLLIFSIYLLNFSLVF